MTPHAGLSLRSALRVAAETIGVIALLVIAVVTTVIAVAAWAEWVDARDRAVWERGPCVCECGGPR